MSAVFAVVAVGYGWAWLGLIVGLVVAGLVTEFRGAR